MRSLVLLLSLSLLLSVARGQVQRITADQGFTGPVAFQSALSPAQITANQNDYAPTGHATANVVRLSSDASRDITGLAGVAAGRAVILVNIGAQPIVLKSASSSSTAANRFALSGDYTLAADTAAWLLYDSTSSRWRLVATSSAALTGSYQPLDATLTALAGVTTSANKLIYATGSDTFTTTDLTTAGRALLDDADAAAQRTTLGIGTIATQAASAVAITGGTIDNTPIGSVTLNTGAFTTLSATGAISTSMTSDGYGLGHSAAGTNRRGLLLLNSGATTVLGVETSAGATMISGSPAYSTVLTTFDANPVLIGVNNSERGRFSSTGLSVTGTLGVTAPAVTSGYGSLVGLGNSGSFPTLASGQGTAYGNPTLGLVLAGNGSAASTTIVTSVGAGIAQFSSTGLDVTGTSGATGNVWSGNNGFSTTSGTTDGAYMSPSGLIVASRDGSAALDLRRRTSDGAIAFFERDTTTVGSISVTTTATAYNTSSDARLKRDIRAAPSAEIAAIVEDIRIREYAWRANSQRGIGPIAQELAAVHPLLVEIGAVTPGDGQAVDYDAWRARKARVDARHERNKAAREAYRAAVEAAQQQAKLFPAPEELAARAAALAEVEQAIAAIAPDDRQPIRPRLPPEPVMESHPEDDEKDFVQWQVDLSKLVPLLIDYAQATRQQLRQQRQRLDALEARLAALEAAKPQP